jgi:hypothetical protein
MLLFFDTGICPKAFNPETLESLPNRRSIRMSTSVDTGFLSGFLVFTFGLDSVKIPADARTLTSESCSKLVTQLKTVSSAACVISGLDMTSGSANFDLTFESFPVRPYENNLFYHDGNPALEDFACNVSGVDNEDAHVPFCGLSDVIDVNVPGKIFTFCRILYSF